MNGMRNAAVSAAEKEAFERDGVVCLRGVLTPEEVEHLRGAVARQMARLGRSGTGYDFEALAKHIWNLPQPVETGAADRFDRQAMKALIHSDGLARPLLEEGTLGQEGLFSTMLQPGVRNAACARSPSIPVCRILRQICSARAI